MSSKSADCLFQTYPMGRKKALRQDTEYIRNYFGSNTSAARRRYSAYVKAGIDQRRKPELVGIGSIRSLGG